MIAALLLFRCLVAETARDVVYRVDPERSEITFVLHATAHKVHGKTRGLRGDFMLPNRIEGPSMPIQAKIEINAASLDTENKKRDAKMYSETLDVARYPWITFQLETVRGELNKLWAGEESDLTLDGTLVIRDASRKVSVECMAHLEKQELQVQGEYALNWADYGLPDPSVLLLRVKKEMTIMFSVVAVPDRM